MEKKLALYLRSATKTNALTRLRKFMEKKLAIYSRTSTEKQEKGLEAQQRALHEYLEYKKIAIDQVVEFSDDGVSGMKRSRPGFDQMMTKVRAGEIHTVVVYSYSRFARSTAHLIQTLDEFGELKVAFVSLSENIDTTTAAGKLMFTIVAGFAEFERNQTVERVKNGLKNAKAKGKKLGTPKKFDLAEIRKMHDRGMSLIEIQGETAATLEQVRTVLELHGQGIELPGIKAETRLPKSYVSRILKFHKTGMPVEEIRMRTGISRGTWQRAVAKKAA